MYSKLESLRGIAACMVVLYHSMYSYSDEPLRIVSNAYLFVDFFFILSGFVISFAYAEKISNGFPLKLFVALRLGRIYPLHIFMLVMFVLYVLLKAYLHSLGFGGSQEYDKNNLYSFFTNALLIHSIGFNNDLTWNYPSWSISVEFFTYLIFFLFLRTIDKNKQIIVPIIITISSYSFLILVKPDMDITYDLGLIRCMAAFYLGVLLFRIKPKLGSMNINPDVSEVVAFLFVVIAVSFSHNGWVYQMLSVLSFFFAMHVFSNTDNGFLGRLLHTSAMRAVGVWSYSIYMVHAFLLTFIGSFIYYILKIDPETITGIHSIWLNMIILSLTLLVSRYTYIYIEDKYRRVVKVKIHELRERNRLRESEI